MRFFQVLKAKKIFFFQIFLTLYIFINIIGGERGLISYFDKSNHEKKLAIKSAKLEKRLNSTEYKNRLLSQNINLDYLDFLYRAKFKFGKKNEILIKIK